MIKITITKVADQKLFDRMPLPKVRRRLSGAFSRQVWSMKSEPFVRRISKIY